MKLNLEEQLLIKILFSENEISAKEISMVNMDLFVKIGSSHLVLPLIYSKLKAKNYLHLFDKELVKFIKTIYEINKNRNSKLKEEVKEIAEFLNQNGFNHVFLKGSAMIFRGLYESDGERMIGDIDFLVELNETKRLKYILKKNKYNYVTKNNFRDYRHIPRMIKKNKMFAIEAHKEIIDKNVIINPKDFLSSAIQNYKINIPSIKNLLIHNILSFQINDKGNLKMNYSFRNIYDTILLINKEDFDLVKISKKYKLNRYFLILNKLGIYNKPEIEKEFSLTSKMLYNLKYFSNFNIRYYDKIIGLFIRIEVIPKQIRDFLFKKKYRKYIFKKVKF